MIAYSAGMSRRRGAVLDDAILAAAWQEMDSGGYSRTTMSGIAARAGTSKAVLYRRWSGLAELALDILKNRMRALTPPDTGGLRGDLCMLLGEFVEVFARLPEGMIAGIIADSLHDPVLFREVQAQIGLSQLSARVAAVVDGAVTRGEIPPVTLPERVLLLPFDVARHDFIVLGRLLDAEQRAELVDQIMLPLIRGHARG
jgi:AcrR family transcriptional regulator